MVIGNKELMEFYGCSAPTAIKRKKELMDYFETPSGRIFESHLAIYEGIAIEEVCFILKIKFDKTKYPFYVINPMKTILQEIEETKT